MAIQMVQAPDSSGPDEEPDPQSAFSCLASFTYCGFDVKDSTGFVPNVQIVDCLLLIDAFQSRLSNLRYQSPGHSRRGSQLIRA